MYPAVVGLRLQVLIVFHLVFVIFCGQDHTFSRSNWFFLRKSMLNCLFFFPKTKILIYTRTHKGAMFFGGFLLYIKPTKKHPFVALGIHSLFPG